VEIKATDVKKLRDATGAGMMECKKALEDSGGDIDAATKLLRERGIASAAKFAQRAAGEGVVEAYLHTPDPMLPAKLGVLVELNCATDFVAKTERFRNLAREIALHVSFAKPAYLTREEVPSDVIEREREIYAKQAEGKPENVVEKMVAGKLEGFFAEQCLVDQRWIRDDKKSIGTLVDEASGELKEPVKISRFAWFRVGG